MNPMKRASPVSLWGATMAPTLSQVFSKSGQRSGSPSPKSPAM
uniref:Uncharacterized protein n=1 Tax=Anguilla anguilla TaxID=7936 RepID=A0A0E9XCA1_ANGAN